MSEERAIPYLGLGCQPSYSGGDELVISFANKAYIIFAAITLEDSDRGFLEDLGVAVVTCEGCGELRHGYPNDEGLPEHPLYTKGLDQGTTIYEVLNSSWKEQDHALGDRSARRIHGDSYERSYGLAPGETRQSTLRHFVFCFKESTCECLTKSISVVLTWEPEKFVREILTSEGC
jgi:hypothetical protein